MALLLNNIFLSVAAAAILLGTVYPIFIDAMGDKISVGPPYFNVVFLTLASPIAVLVGIGMLIRWKNDNLPRLLGKLKYPLLVAIVLSVLLGLLLPEWHWQAFAGLMMALWVVSTVVLALAERFQGRSIASALRSTPRGFYGMILGHMGIAFFIIGVTFVSLYQIEKDLRMKPGDSFEMAGYTFTFNGVRMTDVLNYQAARGDFFVTDNDGFKAEMTPEKRVYRVQKNPMTEAAIDAGFTRDLFVALGEEVGNDGSWAIRIYYKPFIRWIWLGALIMAFGGLLAGTDKRYRQMARREMQVAGNTVGSAA
jgi:cytochrome c-type biogenesis protein CcmF